MVIANEPVREERDSVIFRAQNGMLDQLTILEKVIETLHDRLVPVLAPHNAVPNVEVEAVPSGQSEYAAHIYRCTERIRNETEKLSDLIFRCEV